MVFFNYVFVFLQYILCIYYHFVVVIVVNLKTYFDLICFKNEINITKKRTRWGEFYCLHNDTIIMWFCKMADFAEKCWITAVSVAVSVAVALALLNKEDRF